VKYVVRLKFKNLLLKLRRIMMLTMKRVVPVMRAAVTVAVAMTAKMMGKK
jgi:hypothetical protein